MMTNYVNIPLLFHLSIIMADLPPQDPQGLNGSQDERQHEYNVPEDRRALDIRLSNEFRARISDELSAIRTMTETHPINITSLGLNSKIFHSLNRSDISTVGQLIKTTRITGVSYYSNIGYTSALDLTSTLLMGGHIVFTDQNVELGIPKDSYGSTGSDDEIFEMLTAQKLTLLCDLFRDIKYDDSYRREPVLEAFINKNFPSKKGTLRFDAKRVSQILDIAWRSGFIVAANNSESEA